MEENERNVNGGFTDMALAVKALIDNGCDCEDGEESKCIYCLCSKALSVERSKYTAAYKSLVDAYRIENKAGSKLQEASRLLKILLATVNDQPDKAIYKIEKHLFRLRRVIDVAKGRLRMGEK